MGLHGTGLLASAVPIGGTIALVLVLALGAFALHLARRTAASAREPIFPEPPATAEETEAFTHALAAGGTLADDAAHFTDVANRSGVQQAYALLALMNGDPSGTAVTPEPAVRTRTDPFAALAQLDTSPVSDLAEAAATVADEPRVPPGDDTIGPGPGEARPDGVDAPRPATVHPDDTMLPARRNARAHGTAA